MLLGVVKSPVRSEGSEFPAAGIRNGRHGAGPLTPALVSAWQYRFLRQQEVLQRFVPGCEAVP